MPRPVNADAEATQLLILKAAISLFSSQGVDGTSVREIAKRAGVSLAMVHHYFGSKEGLYDACISAMIQELGKLSEELNQALSRVAASPQALLEEALRVGYRFAREHQMAVRLLQRSIIDAGQVNERLRNSSVLPFLDNMSMMIGALANLPPADLRLPLQSIVFLIARYALVGEVELQLIAGVTSHQQGIAAVEKHLMRSSLLLLGVPFADPVS